MSVQRIHAKKLFNGEDFLLDQVLTIEQGKIIAIDDDITNVDESLQGLVVLGFIDLQVNGGGGVLFNSTPTVAGIKSIMQAHAQFGTTAMLPTLITDTVEVMQQAADSIAEAIKEKYLALSGCTLRDHIYRWLKKVRTAKNIFVRYLNKNGRYYHAKI